MDVQTSGNDLAHVILRGGVDKYGTCQPNYHYEDCLRLFELYQKKDLKNPAAIVDANHSNSNKKYKDVYKRQEQETVLRKSVLITSHRDVSQITV